MNTESLPQLAHELLRLVDQASAELALLAASPSDADEFLAAETEGRLLGIIDLASALTSVPSLNIASVLGLEDCATCLRCGEEILSSRPGRWFHSRPLDCSDPQLVPLGAEGDPRDVLVDMFAWGLRTGPTETFDPGAVGTNNPNGCLEQRGPGERS